MWIWWACAKRTSACAPRWPNCRPASSPTARIWRNWPAARAGAAARGQRLEARGRPHPGRTHGPQRHPGQHHHQPGLHLGRPPRHPHRHQHGPCGPRAAGQPPCRHGPAHHRPGQPHRRVRPAEPLGRHPERTGPGTAAGSGLCGTRRPGDRRGDPHHLRSGRQISQGHPRGHRGQRGPLGLHPVSGRHGRPLVDVRRLEEVLLLEPSGINRPLRPSEPAPDFVGPPRPPKRER